VNYLDRARELFDSGLQWDEVNQQINEEYPDANCPTGEALRKRVFRARKKGDVTFEDKREPPTDEDVDRFLAVMREAQSEYDRLDTRQTTATIIIDTDLPIGLNLTGDWHTGHIGTDYGALDYHTGLMATVDGFKNAVLGDMKDNYISSGPRGGQHEAQFKPGTQDLVAMRYARKIGHNTLWILEGCHDHWDVQQGHESFVATIAKEVDAVNLWHGGLVRLRVGNITYTIATRHKYWGESKLNSTNTQRNLFRDLGNPDIVAVGHKHYPDVHHTTKANKQPIFIRCGAYKVREDYGQRLGGYSAIPAVPTVILYPDQKKMVPFMEIEDAAKWLESERR